MSLDVNKMTKDQLRQHILMLAMELTQLEIKNKDLKEKVKLLEEWLDRKEKINKKLRSDLLMYQHQYWCLTD